MIEPLDSPASDSDFLDYPSALGNCTDEQISFKMQYLPVIYSIIFLVGFPGNTVAISIYIFKMRPWRGSTVIMLNLALTDLLYLTSLPFLIHYYASGENWITNVNFWPISIFVCYVFGLFNVLSEILRVNLKNK